MYCAIKYSMYFKGMDFCQFTMDKPIKFSCPILRIYQQKAIDKSYLSMISYVAHFSSLYKIPGNEPFIYTHESHSEGFQYIKCPMFRPQTRLQPRRVNAQLFNLLLIE